MKNLAAVLCLIVMTVVTPVAVASPLSGQAAPDQRQQLEARVRRAFQNRVRQDLELQQGEVRQLTEVVQWSEGERRGITQRTRQLAVQSVNFLRDGGTEDEARAILETRMALQREEADLFAEEQERLLTVLSPNQVVRFYRLRDQFNRRLQQARARRAGNR